MLTDMADIFDGNIHNFLMELEVHKYSRQEQLYYLNESKLIYH